MQAHRSYKFIFISLCLTLSLSLYLSIYLSIFFSFSPSLSLCLSLIRHILCRSLHSYPLASRPYYSVIRSFPFFPLFLIVPVDRRVRDCTNAIYLSYFLSSVLVILRMADHPSPPIFLASKFSYTYNTTLSTCLCHLSSRVHILLLSLLSASFSIFLLHCRNISRSFSCVYLLLASSHTHQHTLILPLAFSQSLRTYAPIHVCAAEPRKGSRDGRIV